MIPMIILILSVWLYIPDQVDHAPKYNTVAAEKEIAGMRYHGINFATWKNGVGTFERNGKICKVYTQAFEKVWKKKEKKRKKEVNKKK